MGMSPLIVKKLGFMIFMIVLASTLSVSCAGRPSILVHTHINLHDEVVERSIHEHERLLRMNTKDYGYNRPAPRLERPPFKLIPN
ncbi:protein CASPARIAN STRIP INTEGRITY FACTOR 1 [Capsella rubella]|nr:protein CASPARIAN STRIP INTEGRITY FACTOR 1 [Capsella rubella]